MKTLSEINQTLEAFEKQFGFPVVWAEQGSETWLKIKLGVPSASNAHKIVAKVGSDTRLSYMAELVAQVATGEHKDISSKHMEWGKLHEDAARSAYEFETGLTITQLPFVFKDSRFRVGCSPDGIVTETKGMEIKCSSDTTHFIKFLCEEKMKPEFDWQTQFTLNVMDAEEWDFVHFDPRMRRNPIHTVTVFRDEKKQKTLDDAIPQFIEDMDKMLKRAGFEFGDQWRNL